MDEFIKSYITAALWSSTDQVDEQGGEPLDANYSPDDLAPETLARIQADCESFYRDHIEDIVSNVSRAGHDFWLTRNRHGSGFWDGDWEKETGRRLTEASHKFGELELYVGDDGLLYF